METKIVRVPQGLTSAPYNQKSLKFKDLSVIESCVFSDTRTGTMFLEDHLLLFVLEGTYKARHGREEYTVRKNQMVLLKKAVVIDYHKAAEPGQDSRVEYMMFFLKDDLLKDFIKIADIKSLSTDESAAVPVSVREVNERLLKYLDSLKPYFSESEKIEENLIRLKLLELLFDLTNTDQNILAQLLQLNQISRKNIKAIVEENLLNPVSLNELAYLSGRSLSSFKRDFQALYNMPPSQWIREQRLEKAKDLLLNKSMSVTDVCYTTGFENIAHFSRLFKSHFGYSPSSHK
ncbi:Helix-turn-helix domain-containing protein [Dyadobacter koreensis]|uniref:Helix-turn-helix domain-containing protein n=1 Tax=Dyadobacter koreensis TaxID=408657 RepID=A0A1H6XDT5_9BACT|nr:AraC family transcriptional regulator [Dyadobacter koreensis]SEJ27288.1 Helix-turn-helix domain-containing protein [Dyadobacter koreensis]